MRSRAAHILAATLLVAGTTLADDVHSPSGRLSPLLPLALTEIMYHPAPGGAEFVELENVGQKPVSLAGVSFSDGVELTFPADAVLAPGAFAVLTGSAADFAAAYPGVTLAGVYDGALDNGGETLTLRYPGGQQLLSLTYDDDAPWPTEADGLGHSIALSDPAADPHDPLAWCSSAEPGGSPGSDEPSVCPPRVDPTGAIFDPGRVLHISIELPPADWQALRLEERNLLALFAGEDCLAAPFGSPFNDYVGTVTVDGVRLEQVGVRKKGFLGSLSSDKPSLKLRFDESFSWQRLSGLRRMTLNNCQQDLAFISQCLGYQLFAAASVPAPRCNFATVTVNGESLGLYAHVETVREQLLARHFEDSNGLLYEGTLSDFRPEWVATFELEGDGDDDRSHLQAVVAAMEAGDPELVATLDPLLDLDAFFTFWAMEALVGHWDGYTGNTNNFYLYHEPASGRFHFIPWGIDAILRPQGELGGDAVAPSVLATGILPRRLYLNPPTRDAYVQRVLALLDQAWDDTAILAEVDRMVALVQPHLLPSELDGFTAGVAGIRAFVQSRRAQVTAELVPQPPPWEEPLRDPVCFTPIGDLSATFATTWGSMGADPFLAGSATLVATLYDHPLTVLAGGAVAGPGEVPDEQALVAVAAALADGTFAIVLVQTSPDLIADGAVLDLEQSPNLGLLLHLDPASGLGPTLVGLLADGSLSLDQASTAQGAPVSGSLHAVVYGATF